jgi:hypothetical protein
MREPFVARVGLAVGAAVALSWHLRSVLAGRRRRVPDTDRREGPFTLLPDEPVRPERLGLMCAGYGARPRFRDAPNGKRAPRNSVQEQSFAGCIESGIAAQEEEE